MTFGEYVKRLRCDKNLTLKEFCQRTGFDPVWWSKVERGVTAPPKDAVTFRVFLPLLTEKWIETGEKLLTLANDWTPQADTTQAVLGALPLIYHTITGEKPTKKQIDKLIEKIKLEGGCYGANYFTNM